jgi:hypothetical protein
MDEVWMSIEEYSKLTQLDTGSIEDLIERGKLTTKEQNGVIYIDPAKGTQAVVPTKDIPSEVIVGPQFVEKTIGTIINLHEKVLGAKDETIESIKNENLFLKEALASLQELYEEDRKTIDTLTKQLQLSQKEVEFMRRKYKLMWGKVVDEYAEKKD